MLGGLNPKSGITGSELCNIIFVDGMIRREFQHLKNSEVWHGDRHKFKMLGGDDGVFENGGGLFQRVKFCQFFLVLGGFFLKKIGGL